MESRSVTLAPPAARYSWLLGLLTIAVAIALTVILWPAADRATSTTLLTDPVSTPPQAQIPSAPANAALTRKAEDSSEPAAAGSQLAAELNSTAHAPDEDVKILHSLLRQYLRRLHHRQGLPIGDDIDLGRALTGHNPMKAVILPRNNPALTGDGHLRDRWGTPYFIHPRGYGSFEIRSAGPDRKLFTTDDLIADPGHNNSGEPLSDEPG